MLQKEIRDLTFKVSNLSLHFFKILSYKGPSIYDIQRWGGLETCHMFTDCIVLKQQIYC